MRILKYRIIFFSLVVLTTNFSISQNFNVDSFQKINETNGNFTGILNDGDSFGVSIDNIGDLDGNGVNDLAVGAYGDDDGGVDKGAVWILFMDANDMVISHTKISNNSGNFNGALDPNDRFGGGVAYLGDMNNDGLIELAVTADYDGDGGYWHGAFWILSLNSNGTVNSYVKISDTQGNFTGIINDEAIFGTDIENIGDLNNDGIADLAVGSRRDDDGGSQRGAVWILFLNSNFTVNSYQKISDTQGNFTAALDPADYFGGSVASVGDLNGDGVTDIVVGSYRDDDLNVNSGSFYVLFLNSNGTVSSYQKVSNTAGGLTSIISNDALFGESIDGVVDIDNDGKIEIVVGALRQINPTLSVQTGAFYIIELNTDGTVSESNFYTYLENCFSGELNNQDFFGGSVTILNDNNSDIKIATGAYRDSENGFRKGAAWILNLGEIFYNLESFTNPTTCGSNDGTIVISGLNSGLSYTITYDYNMTPVIVNLFADANGEIQITGLVTGIYDNIIATEDVSGCSDNLGQVILNATTLVLTIQYTDPTTCGATDGTITISGLNSGEDYTITYDYNMAPVIGNYVADANGEVQIIGLAEGIYDNIIATEDNTGCSDDLGQVILDALEFAFTIQYTDPTTCGAADGTITISGLISGEGYSITYTYNMSPVITNLIADANGEIQISGLMTGTYDTIIVTEDITGCYNDMGQVVLDDPDLDFSIGYTDPTTCGASDGTITISNVTVAEAYTITYVFNGSPVIVNQVGDANGELIITGLSEGTFDTIIVTEDNFGCTDDMGQVILDDPDLNFSIGYTYPTTCGALDGTITISNVTVGEAYTITYVFNGSPVIVNQIGDTNGELIITGLSEGTYDTIIVTEDNFGCTDDMGQVILDDPDLDFSIGYTDPTTCGASDGTITISNVTVGEAYTITYVFNGSPVIVNQVGDANGELIITGLSEGTYNTFIVTETLSGCTDIFGSIELICASEQFTCFSVRKFFTPNNDGYQDYWNLINAQCDYILYIYDRYGKLLKILSPDNYRWDGNYNGRKMPSNDYWYRVDYSENGQELTYRSHFALKR